MKYFIILAFFFAIALGYNLWLNSGCDPYTGVMTWQGKVCFEDLAK